jgi:hypothetical protein
MTHAADLPLLRVKFKLITLNGDDLEPGDLAQVISIENFPNVNAVVLHLLNTKGQAVELAILRKDAPNCFVVEQGILNLGDEDADSTVSVVNSD